MFLMVYYLLATAGTITVEMHENATILGCYGRASPGFVGAVYQIYSLDDEADAMVRRTFTLTQVGDTVPSSTGWLCEPGAGLPPMWLTET